MAIVVGSILFIYLIILKIQKNVNLLAPMTLFPLIILATYFLATLQLSGLQHEYPAWFTLLIFAIIGVFLIGTQFVNIMHWTKDNKSIRYNSWTIKILSFIMWMSILGSFFAEIIVLGLPPAISGTIRNQYFVSGIGSIVALQSSFWGMIIYDRYHQRNLGKLFWLYAMTIVVIAVLLSNKYQIIYMGLILLIAYNSFKKRIKIKTFAIFTGFVILLFIGLFGLVYQNMYNITFDKIATLYQMKLPESLNVLAQPYLYVAFNYENLYGFLISDHNDLYGLATFQGVFKFFSLDKFYSLETQSILEQREAALNIDAMNTGTMFEDFAQDGDLFIFVFTFLFGMLTCASYKNFKVNQSFFSFYLFVSTTSAIFMAFFVNSFTSKITLVNLLAAYFMSFILHKVIITR